MKFGGRQTLAAAADFPAIVGAAIYTRRAVAPPVRVTPANGAATIAASFAKNPRLVLFIQLSSWKRQGLTKRCWLWPDRNPQQAKLSAPILGERTRELNGEPALEALGYATRQVLWYLELPDYVVHALHGGSCPHHLDGLSFRRIAIGRRHRVIAIVTCVHRAAPWF